jgi:hypothetical protein
MQSETIDVPEDAENENKISSYFKQADLPLPSNYCTQENKEFNIQFSNSQSEELWEYMGDPLPDFQYKWPEEYR